ncbi:MAG: MBL fold metallo-hydrolase [Kiritimatiellae bacterium]|nr:MBL fold metallo-hydrolase [Kiritimatiellia bacterium]
MFLRLCILASGSSGNCTYIGSSGSSLLIDAGLSGKETERRLGEIGVVPAGLRAICVSHEHGDHVMGLRVLHRRHGIPLYANAGTIEAVGRDPLFRELPWQVFTTGSPFQVGDLQIEPFSVAHDAYDPVGFIVSAGAVRVGIVTDMGVATTLVRQRLRNCHALVIEANHDLTMLDAAERPASLKQRIRGRQGHLSNDDAAAVVAEVAGPHLQQVFLAHLSADCNRVDVALRTVRRILDKAGHGHVRVSCAFPDRVSEVWMGNG